MKRIILENPTPDRNGLFAIIDEFNPKIVNIRKFSYKSRDNGLVARYSLNTHRYLFDGMSWRSYKSSKLFDKNADHYAYLIERFIRPDD